MLPLSQWQAVSRGKQRSAVGGPSIRRSSRRLRRRVTGALRVPRVLNEAAQPGGRFKAKFVVKQRPVARELTHSLGHIAFGQENPDESCVAGFPQWFSPHGGTGGDRRFAPAPGR